MNRILKYLVLVLVTISVQGCKNKPDFNKWYEGLSSSKGNIEVLAAQDSFSKEDLLAMGSYFRELAKGIYWMQEADSLPKKIKDANKLKNPTSVCNQVLISKDTWNDLLNKCEYMGTFICNEESKHYESIVTSLNEHLLSKNTGLNCKI